MKVVRALEELRQQGGKVSLAIGVFDGLHLGHQEVIGKTLADARKHGALAVVVTFDRHPNALLAPVKAPALIYSLEKRLKVLEELGIDAVLLLTFDEKFSRQTAEEFVTSITANVRLVSLAVGSGFTFGHKRTGNVELLSRYGSEHGFVVHSISSFAYKGEVVSSTKIREEIKVGNFARAGELLGRSYTLAGKVVEGAHLGRTIGIPTANIAATELVLPPNGVYAAQVKVKENWQRSVVNIGVRPTVSNTSVPVVEAHLLEFSGDLYGEWLEIEFIGKLREEQKFESVDALRKQIDSDISAAKKLF